MSEPIEEPVPKLPRGRGLKFSGPELFRIALTLVTLIGVIVLTRPCATAVSGFVTGFDGSASEKQMPKPGNVDVPAPPQQMEALRPGMTDEEIRAAIKRAKARAAGTSSPATGSGAVDQGSAPSGSAPSGSAPGGSAPGGSAPSGSAPSGSAPSGSAPSASGSSAPPTAR